MGNFFKKMFEFGENDKREDKPAVLREYKSEDEIDRDYEYFQERQFFNVYGENMNFIVDLLVGDCFSAQETLDILEKYIKIPVSKYKIDMFFIDYTTINERKQEILRRLDSLMAK